MPLYKSPLHEHLEYIHKRVFQITNHISNIKETSNNCLVLVLKCMSTLPHPHEPGKL